MLTWHFNCLKFAILSYMPADSEQQRRAAGAALSAKRDDTRVSDLKGASKEMYDSMTEEELSDMASKDE